MHFFNLLDSLEGFNPYDRPHPVMRYIVVQGIVLYVHARLSKRLDVDFDLGAYLARKAVSLKTDCCTNEFIRVFPPICMAIC